jgi:hypothetical protein
MTMTGNSKNWLQLYVDAMTEKDPYKRLSLVRELKSLPREDDSDDRFDVPEIQPFSPRNHKRMTPRKSTTRRRR